MYRYSFISENSRKSKSARHLYDHLRHKVPKEQWSESVEWESIHGSDGIPVPDSEKARVLSLRLLDEHLSPYVKTDLNLFQMHMMDDSMRVVVYKADHGWLLVFEGVTDGPKPFGQNGFDTR